MVERSRSAEGGVVLFQGENFGGGGGGKNAVRCEVKEKDRILC